MTEPHGNDLFPSPDTADVDRSTGLLPSQMLREAVALGREIVSPQPIGDDQIQPASIDLRLGMQLGGDMVAGRMKKGTEFHHLVGAILSHWLYLWRLQLLPSP